MKRKRRNITLMIIFIVIFHFAISIIAGIKIGAESRKLLEDRSKIPRSVLKDSEIAKQWLEKELRAAIGFWYQTYHLFQDYPVGWILAPKEAKIQREIRDEYLAGSLSRSQVAVRIGILAFVKACINSLFTGFLLLLGVHVVRKTMKKT